MGSQVNSGEASAMAIMLQDTRATLWEEETTTGLRDLTVGAVSPGQSSGLALRASGTPDRVTDFQYRVSRGGSPGPRGMRLLMRKGRDADDAAADVTAQPYFGDDSRTHIVHSEGISAHSVSRQYPCSIELRNGTLLVVAVVTTGSTLTLARRIYSPSTGWGSWSNISLSTQALPTNSWNAHPALILLEDNTIVLYAWRHGDSNSNIGIWVSRDDGDNFELSSRACLPTAGDSADLLDRSNWATGASQRDVRIRAAYGKGQVSLWVTMKTSSQWEAYQYASGDNGFTFRLVKKNEDKFGTLDVAYVDGLFVVCAVDVSLATHAPFSYRYGSAFDDAASTGRAVIMTGGTLGWGTDDLLECGLVAEPTGILWFYAGGTSASGSGGKYHWVWRSRDYADSAPWDELSGAVSNQWDRILWWDMGSAQASFPDRWHAANYRGSTIILANGETTSGAQDDAIRLYQLGGWSTIPMPVRDETDDEYLQAAPHKTWHPLEALDHASSDFTLTSTGGTNSLSTSSEEVYHRIQAGGTGSEYHVETWDASVGEMIVLCRLQVDSGTATVYAGVTNATSYEIGVNVSTTQVRSTDRYNISYTNDTDADPDAGIEIKIAIRENSSGSGEGAVWWRPASDGGLAPARRWTLIQEYSSLTDNGSTLAGFGGGGPGASSNRRIVIEGGNGCDVRVYSVARYVSTSDVGRQLIGDSLADGVSSPSDLTGRAIVAHRSTYVDEGHRIRAVAGPAAGGDTFTMTPTSHYPEEHLLSHLHPSPSATWRSADTTTGVHIAWKIGDVETGISDAYPMYGLWLDGLTCREITVSYHNGTSWTAHETIDMSEDLFSWERKGDMVRRNPIIGSDSQPYLYEGELAGGYIELGSDVRKIVKNTSGTFHVTTAEHPRATLTLDGITGSEGTSGTNARIWFPRVFIALGQWPAEMKGIRITLNPNGYGVPSDGYYSARKVMFGRIRMLGRKWSRSGDMTIADASETYQTRSGSRRSVQVAQREPVRRFDWMGGVGGELMKPVRGTTNDPDYRTLNDDATYGVAEYALGELPELLRGLMDETQGPVQPVVVIPYLIRQSTLDKAVWYTYQRCRGTFYGVLESAYATEHAGRGDEQVDERMRVRQMTFREVLA